jgi:hypothetical protein
MAAALWRLLDGPTESRLNVRKATARATCNPFSVAAAMAWEAGAGSALPTALNGFPTRVAKRAAKPGFSSNRTAVRNDAASSGDMNVASIRSDIDIQRSRRKPR